MPRLSTSHPAALALALVAVLALGGCATLDRPAPGEGRVRYEDGGELGDAGYFYDALSPYGRWLEVSPYGLCWMPQNVGAGWSPYSRGFWTYSDYGWTWVDQEPWGWAPFHYGRWWLDPEYGWMWIPGSEWAPAWVAWRENEAYVAWAPLPPTIHWSFTVPLHTGGAAVDALPPPWWNAARPTDLFASNLRDRLVPEGDKLTALTRAEDRTRITVRDEKPFNEGPPLAAIERALGRPVPRLQVVDAPRSAPAKAGDVTGDRVAFYRPDLAAMKPGRARMRPDLRQRPPQAGVAPAPGSVGGKLGGALRPAVSDSARVVSFVESERKKLADAQARERLLGRDRDALAVQHARENRAFDAWAERQRGQVGSGKPLTLAPFDRKAEAAADSSDSGE